jgi:formylglycine-generating enzyme required for sulfatase activity
MFLIPSKGASFSMGGTMQEWEMPVHTVTFTYNYWMDTTEVTQEDYLCLMDTNPSYFTGDLKRPVETVSWYDAILYCNARSRRDNLDTVYQYESMARSEGGKYVGLINMDYMTMKNGYRLPTEAEWEFACRAHATTNYYWGDTMNQDYAWYLDNSIATTHPVAQKLKNAFHLYDMSGNVWEWCLDWFGDYSAQNQTDPTGPINGEDRVVRGGFKDSDADEIRSAKRNWVHPTYACRNDGFRCVRTEIGK